MIEVLKNFVKNLAKLIDVKSLVTLGFAAVIIIVILRTETPPDWAADLFKVAFGMIITYFFTKKTDAAE